MSLVTVGSYYNSTQAYLAKGKLESHDIKCFILHENFTTLMPHFTNMLGGKGIELKVSDSDYERAKALLIPEPSSTIIKCPNCGSEDVRLTFGKNKSLKWFFVFISLILFIPFSNIKRNYVCNRCSDTF